MTDSQKLDLILKSTKMIESDVGTLKQDVSMLKDNCQRGYPHKKPADLSPAGFSIRNCIA